MLSKSPNFASPASIATPSAAPGLDRVQAEVVAHVVEPGDVIQVAQAQVRAQQGDRLVLKRADDGLAGLVHVDVAAGDHAARHAARADLAAAGQDGLAQRLAAQARPPPQSCRC